MPYDDVTALRVREIMARLAEQDPESLFAVELIFKDDNHDSGWPRIIGWWYSDGFEVHLTNPDSETREGLGGPSVPCVVVNAGNLAPDNPRAVAHLHGLAGEYEGVWDNAHAEASDTEAQVEDAMRNLARIQHDLAELL